MPTMMLTAINKCNWLQLEIVGRRFMVTVAAAALGVMSFSNY